MTLQDEHPTAEVDRLEYCFLGLALRGCLTDPDREALDSLAPDGWCAFLIANGRYLHPDDVELFPPHAVATTALVAGGAVLARRIGPDARTRERMGMVYCSNLSGPNEAPLLFGLFGPQGMTNRASCQECAHSAIGLAREAHDEARSLIPRLQAALDSEFPTALVNRDSKRVIAVNVAMAAQLRHQPSRLWNVEFEDARALLDAHGDLAPMRVENVGGSRTAVAIVRSGVSAHTALNESEVARRLTDLDVAADDLEDSIHRLENDRRGLLRRLADESTSSAEATTNDHSEHFYA